jgi:isopentenyldiphosphate isomerase
VCRTFFCKVIEEERAKWETEKATLFTRELEGERLRLNEAKVSAGVHFIDKHFRNQIWKNASSGRMRCSRRRADSKKIWTGLWHPNACSRSESWSWKGKGTVNH